MKLYYFSLFLILCMAVGCGKKENPTPSPSGNTGNVSKEEPKNPKQEEGNNPSVNSTPKQADNTPSANPNLTPKQGDNAQTQQLDAVISHKALAGNWKRVSRNGIWIFDDSERDILKFNYDSDSENNDAGVMSPGSVFINKDVRRSGPAGIHAFDWKRDNHILTLFKKQGNETTEEKYSISDLNATRLVIDSLDESSTESQYRVYERISEEEATQYQLSGLAHYYGQSIVDNIAALKAKAEDYITSLRLVGAWKVVREQGDTSAALPEAFMWLSGKEAAVGDETSKTGKVGSDNYFFSSRGRDPSSFTWKINRLENKQFIQFTFTVRGGFRVNYQILSLNHGNLTVKMEDGRTLRFQRITVASLTEALKNKTWTLTRMGGEPANEVTVDTLTLYRSGQGRHLQYRTGSTQTFQWKVTFDARDGFFFLDLGQNLGREWTFSLDENNNRLTLQRNTSIIYQYRNAGPAELPSPVSE